MHIFLLIALLAGLLPTHVDYGLSSVYRPGDGWNSGKLACGGTFTSTQVHVARRDWWKLGCGTKVLVYATATGSLALATVRDAGPFGVYRGTLRDSYKPGNWKVCTKSRPPEGWKWRAISDLSWGLWHKLGKPRALTPIYMLFYKGRSGWVLDWAMSWMKWPKAYRTLSLGTPVRNRSRVGALKPRSLDTCLRGMSRS